MPVPVSRVFIVDKFCNILYLQVAFFSYHGELMKHSLVCLHFNLNQSSQETMRDYIKEICAACDNKAEFPLLELVPVGTLIDGKLIVGHSLNLDVP